MTKVLSIRSTTETGSLARQQDQMTVWTFMATASSGVTPC